MPSGKHLAWIALVALVAIAVATRVPSIGDVVFNKTA